MSFYTLFSLAPLTIIVVGITAMFFGHEIATRQFTDQMNQLVGEASARVIQQTIEANALEDKGTLSTVIGFVLLAVGATTVFAQLQGSLNDIWGVTAKPSRSGWLIIILQRLISFAMVLTVGFLLVTSLILTTAVTAAVKYLDGSGSFGPVLMRVIDLGGGLAVITALFALLFKVLPDVRVSWGEVWRGAIVTACLFTVGRYLIALYLGHSDIASSYGGAGALVALLIWIYYSCAILFFGAEYVRAHRLNRGLEVEPKDVAVRVKRELIEDRPGDAPKRKVVKDGGIDGSV